jgi:putative ABC transport system ATP-binding protein
MINIKNLLFNYPDNSFQIKIDSLDIEAGQQICLYGKSGSGKSSFLKLLSGELECSAAELSINHQLMPNSETKRCELRLNNIGIIFQEPSLVHWLSVKENILLPLKIRNIQPDMARLKTLANTAEIETLLHKKPQQLSLGEQQRVAVVRALLANHKLILADEPTANLDQESAKVISDLILSEASNSTATLIYVSHSPTEQERFDFKINTTDWSIK